MRILKKLSALLGLLLTAGLISGCTGNVVKLNYVPTGAMLQSTGKQVTLLELEDRRPNTAGIGERKDGELFTGDARVTDWASRALADEFIRLGVGVYYAGEGLSSPNAPVLSGSVDTLWLKETGNTSYEVEIKITLVLSDSRGKRIHQESFWGQQTLRAFPSESKFSELMADALHDVTAPAAQAMSRKF